MEFKRQIKFCRFKVGCDDWVMVRWGEFEKWNILQNIADVDEALLKYHLVFVFASDVKQQPEALKSNGFNKQHFDYTAKYTRKVESIKVMLMKPGEYIRSITIEIELGGCKKSQSLLRGSNVHEASSKGSSFNRFTPAHRRNVLKKVN